MGNNKLQTRTSNKLWEIYNDRNVKGIAMFSYEDFKKLVKEIDEELKYDIAK